MTQKIKKNNDKYTDTDKVCKELQPKAVGFAEGKVLKVDNKGNGIIEIDEFRYEMKEGRPHHIREKFPLSNFMGETIKFSFFPVTTPKAIKILKIDPFDPPFIKISRLIKRVKKQGAIEILGEIRKIEEDYFTVSIFGRIAQKEYIATIIGNCEFKVKDIVSINAILKEGLIELVDMKEIS